MCRGGDGRGGAPGGARRGLPGGFKKRPRQAEIHVRPSREGFRIEVIVHKLQEDLAQPEYATVGGATLRHSATHSRPRDLGIVTTETLGWMPAGRDTALEQLMLNELQQRMSEAAVVVSGPPEDEAGSNGLGPIRFPSLGDVDLGLGN